MEVYAKDGGVSVLLGNGDGTFLAAGTYNSGGYGAASVVIGDVNGDGVPDLVVSNECPTQSQECSQNLVDGIVGVLLGNGDGSFQPPMSYDSGGVTANAVALGDLNGDGF
jgi:FG-GAP-like repeat